jgi:hypothetical protein
MAIGQDVGVGREGEGPGILFHRQAGVVWASALPPARTTAAVMVSHPRYVATAIGVLRECGINSLDEGSFWKLP